MNFNAEVKQFSFLVITVIINMFLGWILLLSLEKNVIILNQSKQWNDIFGVT